MTNGDEGQPIHDTLVSRGAKRFITAGTAKRRLIDGEPINQHPDFVRLQKELNFQSVFSQNEKMVKMERTWEKHDKEGNGVEPSALYSYQQTVKAAEEAGIYTDNNVIIKERTLAKTGTPFDFRGRDPMNMTEEELSQKNDDEYPIPVITISTRGKQKEIILPSGETLKRGTDYEEPVVGIYTKRFWFPVPSDVEVPHPVIKQVGRTYKASYFGVDRIGDVAQRLTQAINTICDFAFSTFTTARAREQVEIFKVGYTTAIEGWMEGDAGAEEPDYRSFLSKQADHASHLSTVQGTINNFRLGKEFIEFGHSYQVVNVDKIDGKFVKDFQPKKEELVPHRTKVFSLDAEGMEKMKDFIRNMLRRYGVPKHRQGFNLKNVNVKDEGIKVVFDYYPKKDWDDKKTKRLREEKNDVVKSKKELVLLYSVPGLDENGMPLEVGNAETGHEGKVLSDVYTNVVQKEWLDDATPQLSNPKDMTAEEISELREEIEEEKARDKDERVVPFPYITDLDPVDKATLIFVSYDACRDEIRDGRYHKDSLTIMEYLRQKYKIREEYIAKISQKVFSDRRAVQEYKAGNHLSYTMQLRQGERVWGYKGGMSPSQFNPAFDLRHLKKVKGTTQSWSEDPHRGRIKYYASQAKSLNAKDRPTISTRGVAMYIVDEIIESIKTWPETHTMLEAIGSSTGGYDFGPNLTKERWGRALSNNPFKPISGPHNAY